MHTLTLHARRLAPAALAVLMIASAARADEKTPAGAGDTPGGGEPAKVEEKAPETPPDAQPDPPGEEKPAPTEPAAPRGRTAQLRSLEQRVQALKEQAWRVKARVNMLKEAVLGGKVGARATIIHENKMGGSFRLIKIVYALDGQQVFARADDSGKLNDQKKIDILTGPIAAGNHTLSVLLVYRGHGYGVFEYLKQYKFTVRSSHTITVSEGKQTQVTVVGYERGGVTTPLEKRPAVDFKVNYVTESLGGAKK
jgi:hypothetical protein